MNIPISYTYIKFHLLPKAQSDDSLTVKRRTTHKKNYTLLKTFQIAVVYIQYLAILQFYFMEAFDNSVFFLIKINLEGLFLENINITSFKPPVTKTNFKDF